jgi:hypothetical protein
MQVKHSNWFAAGPEVSRALILLSDGAFKLYFYLCLHSDRGSGSLAVSYFDVALALAKSRRSVATHFEELRCQGVCRIHPAVNQHQRSKIEICDEFWPYTKSEGEDLAARGCVKCAFTAGDQKFAATLLTREVSLEQVERGIALGCSRKYVSLLNGTDTGSIVSFAYFRDLIDEADDQEMPVGYWDYLKPALKRLEEQWFAKKIIADATFASAAAPKNK